MDAFEASSVTETYATVGTHFSIGYAHTFMRKSRDAAAVVGIEDSPLMHGLMTMQPGGLLLYLLSPECFNNVLKDYSDVMGMQYGFVVGHENGDDFQVPIDDILNTIDLATGSQSLFEELAASITRA